MFRAKSAQARHKKPRSKSGAIQRSFRNTLLDFEPLEIRRLLTVVPQLIPGVASAGNFVEFNGSAFFQGSSSVPIHGSELWKTDGTIAGTSLVKNVPLAYVGNPQLGNLTIVNGTLFFTLIGGSKSPDELWKTDGTADGTVLVKECDDSGRRSVCPAVIGPKTRANRRYAGHRGQAHRRRLKGSGHTEFAFWNRKNDR